MPVESVPSRKAAGVEKAMKDLLRLRLMVGIPGSAMHDTEDGKKVSSAIIGYTLEFGDDARRIPPRPFLVPGFRNALPKVTELLAMSGAAVLAGAPASEAKAGMEAAGLIAVGSIRQKMVDGPFAPLAPSTIKARARLRLKDSGRLSQAGPSKNARKYLKLVNEGVPAEVAGDDAIGLVKPLIVTGELRNAVTYVVTVKGQG